METYFWPEDISLGEVIYPPRSKFGPRIQPTIELVWLYRGEMTVWIDGNAHFASAGSVSILFPGHEERFAFAKDAETHHSWAHIRFASFPEVLQARLEQLSWPLPLSPAMSELIREALALRHSLFPTAPELIKTLCTQMIWRYLGEGEYLRLQSNLAAPLRTVEQARQFIQEHLSEIMSLAQIAESVSVSESHLIRLFRQQLGLTPMAYVWQERVNRGIMLLKETGLAVHSIAERCGFQNSFHFSRRVKQTTGLTPLQIRQRA